MANYSFTASAVIPSANATIESGTAGESIAAGDNLYLDTASSTYKLHDANGASATIRLFRGVAANTAATGQRVQVIRKDPALVYGTGLFAIGDTVIASATPGKSAPDADCASGWYKTILGVAVTTGAIDLNPIAVTVAKA